MWFLGYYFHIILTSFDKMILQKDKRNDQQNKPKTNKSIKPYSILSLGFMKHSDKNTANRSRQICDLKTNTKISKKSFKNENGENEVNRESIGQFSSTFSLHSNKMGRMDAENYDATIPSITSIDFPPLDDGILQRPTFLKLENISNQLIEESSKIGTDCFGFGNCQFYDEDDQEQRSHSRVFVDMKKKIKKLSNGKKERIPFLKNRSEMNDLEGPAQPQEKNHPFPLTSRIYSDIDVIADGSIFRNKLISQRIDNDVETDDEQITSGIRRLHRSLADAVEEQLKERKWEEEKQKMLESFD